MKLHSIKEVGPAAELFEDGYVGVRAELLARVLDQCPGLEIGDLRSQSTKEMAGAIAFLSPADVLQLCSYWLQMRDRKTGIRLGEAGSPAPDRRLDGRP